MEANASIWNKLMDVYLITQDKNILDYLTCSENYDILINFINISNSNNFIIQKRDYYNILSSIIQKHSDNDAVLDYMLANLEKINLG